MKIIYNKLIRDKIPEIIEASGKTCETEILSDEEYLQRLDKKLDEELAEYHQEQNIEELADLLEVLYATAKVKEIQAITCIFLVEATGIEPVTLSKFDTQ